MEKAILGTKIGMTQIFGEGGVVIPVTVVMAGPCVVTIRSFQKGRHCKQKVCQRVQT